MLFDTDNPINKMADQYIFTTEGHVFPIRHQFRHKIWEEEDFFYISNQHAAAAAVTNQSVQDCCENVKKNHGGLPLQSDYLAQVFKQIGAELS